MELSNDPANNLKDRYCSWCFEKTLHKIIEKNILSRNIYECTSCEGRTLICRAINCQNMTKGLSKDSAWNDEFCAEHDGTVPNFEFLNKRIDDLDKYEDIYKRKKYNLAHYSKVGIITVAGGLVVGPLTYLSAPAIGGAIGTQIFGLSGAAATSKGLAVLGFGAKAAGGFGMAGGTFVLTATGTLIGGAKSAIIAGSYYNDLEFEIKKVKDGKSPKVIVINGYRTQNNSNIEDWVNGVSKRFLDNSWYILNWESQEEDDLYDQLNPKSYTIYKRLVKQAVKAAKSNKSKLAPLLAVDILEKLIKNPWFIANYKAQQTAVVLSDVIGRLKDQSKCIFLGHSLGGKIALDTSRILVTKRDSQIEETHLLGAAANDLERHEYKNLSGNIDKYLFNYHSRNDKVLANLYKISKLGFNDAIGLRGLTYTDENLINVDVSKHVKSHSDYKPNLSKYIRYYSKR